MHIPHIISLSAATVFYLRWFALGAVTALVAVRTDRRYRRKLFIKEFVKQLQLERDGYPITVFKKER